MNDVEPVSVDNGLLRVGSRRVPLVSGEIQFWRMDPEAWAPAVAAARSAGITMVSTYLSWRRHQPTIGSVDLTGDRDPRLDVRTFLRICADAGVLVQLKPGPWICAEEEGGGYPDWLLARRDLLVLDDRGEVVLGYNPPFQHPVPSWTHAAYLEAVEQWFAAVWEVIADFVHPHGPVVAIQLDNEPSICFQDSMYGSDYNPSSVEAFRAWLGDRYAGDPAALARAWEDGSLTSFRLAEPPRRPLPHAPARARRQLDDWIDFKGHATARHLSQLRTIHERFGGRDLLYTVNLVTHPVHDVPASHATITREVGAATGEDHYYVPPLSTDDIHRLARSAATARAAGEPLPWVPELQAGIWRSPGEVVDYPDPTPPEQEAWWGAASALGFAGANLYMLADRENWQFSPFDAAGNRSGFFAPIEHFRAMLHARPDVLTMAPEASVVVAWHRPDAYAAYAVTGTARVPDVAWHDEAAAAAHLDWERTLRQLLALGMTYDLWDTATPLTPLGDLPVVVPPGSGVPAAALDTVRASGRPVVVLTHETADHQLAQLAARAPGAFGPAGRLEDTLVTRHRAPGGPTYVQVVHWGGGADPVDLHLPGEPDTVARDLVSGTEVPVVGGRIRCALEPGHRAFALAGPAGGQ